ncbi:hypothetical protein BH09ACT1_BH09ACT1_26120 [soil metagenome]
MGLAEIPRNDERAARVNMSLDCVIGHSITRLRRIFYVAQGTIEREKGGLELVTSNGVAILFDSGPDGEAVTAKLKSWVDPFEGELSDENRAWVEEAGKWTAFDVSREADYLLLIGAVIIGAEVRLSEWRNPTGVTLTTSAGRIVANTEWDEFEVRIEPVSPERIR